MSQKSRFPELQPLIRLFTVLVVILSALPVHVVAMQVQPPPGPPLGFLNRKGEVDPLPGLPEGWHFHDPALSPDGKRIAFIASRVPGFPVNDVLVYTLPAGPLTRIATGSTFLAPSWVPGSDDIAYVRRTIGSDSSSFVLQKSDGSDAPRTILSLPVSMSSSTWFPDGKRVVVAHVGTRARREEKMFVLSLDKPDSLVVIADGDLMNSRPALSPDGTLLAYSSAEPAILPNGVQGKGRQTLHVHRFSDGEQLAVNLYAGTNPAWSATGRDLFFQASTTPSRLYKVRIRSGRTLDADNPAVESDYVFDDPGSAFAVLPGDSLLIVRAARAKATIAEVPANIRGKRASIGDQRQLELAAARAVVDLATAKGKGFERFGIDMRAYAVASDGAFAGFADSVKSHLLPAHVEGHIAGVGRILKVAGIVKDENNCIMSGPASCRMGSFAGIVAFSPAIVSADSARITVIRSERGVSATAATAPYTSLYWRVVLVRSGRDWTVRRVSGG